MIKKKSNKGIIITILIALIIISSASFLYLGGFFVPNVVFDNQCSFDNCPSGYSLDSSSASCRGLDCTANCIKIEEAHCGDYIDGYTTNREKIIFDAADRDVYFSTDTYFLSSDKCYKIRAAIDHLTITDDDPSSNWFVLNSESHSLSVQTTWDSENECDVTSLETDWHTINRGKSGSGYTVAGKYDSFEKTACGGDTSYGSEGYFYLGLQAQTADWIEEKELVREISCDFDCNDASDCGSITKEDKYCKGINIVQDVTTPSCSNYECESPSTETIVIESCDYDCEDGACIDAPIVPACSDGLQNQGESGIDCGGPCDACDTNTNTIVCCGTADGPYTLRENTCESGEQNFSLEVCNDIEACEYMYWFDDNTNICGYKEFCGLYIYSGLKTFDTQKKCEDALPIVECSTKADCPQDNCLDYDCTNGICESQAIIPNIPCSEAVWQDYPICEYDISACDKFNFLDFADENIILVLSIGMGTLLLIGGIIYFIKK